MTAARLHRIVLVVLVVLTAGCSSSVRPSTVSIDSDVFAVQGGYGSSNESIVVSGSFSSRDGIAALKRFAKRAMNVDERGVEHRDVYASPPLDETGHVLYTPNYVSDPTVTPNGIKLYVDCKGAIEPAMRERFIAILREELVSLGDVHVRNAT